MCSFMVHFVLTDFKCEASDILCPIETYIIKCTHFNNLMSMCIYLEGAFCVIKVSNVSYIHCVYVLASYIC